MHRYNFPLRKQRRRKAALERLKKFSARDEAHAKQIKGNIEALEAKIESNKIS